MWLRRIRGIATMAILWGIMWIPLGAGFGVFMNWKDGPTVLGQPWPEAHFPSLLMESTLNWALIGLVLGGLWSVLMMAGAHRDLGHLARWRLIGWGAFGGVAAPIFLVAVRGSRYVYAGWLWHTAAYLVATGIAGAATAALMLQIARPIDTTKSGTLTNV